MTEKIPSSTQKLGLEGTVERDEIRDSVIWEES